LAILLSLLPTVSGGATGGFDLATMKNGDIFNGRIEVEAFDLATEFGRVLIPGHAVAEIRIGEHTAPDLLRTRSGDLYSGRLEMTDLVMERVLAPALPLTTRDIAVINFAPGRSVPTEFLAPSLVETQSGDYFHARITTGELMIQSDSSVELINLSRVRHLDALYSEEAQRVRAQFTLHDGSRFGGDLLTKSIQVQERYGSMLSIPSRVLDRISFRVSAADGPGEVTALDPFQAAHPRFRDYLPDGTPGPEMMRLEGGRFIRGDLQGDGDTDELPPSELDVGEFAIGVYEVTFEDYDRFCESTGCRLPDDQGWGRGRRPVVNVTWDMATAYTGWLSGQTGNRYRLPTDAEWEYAARGGTQNRFWWGGDPGSARSNCAECGSLWDGEKTSRVGRFNPNPFGLYDTAGNVFEWVTDCWNDDFSLAPKNGSAVEKPNCGVRVIRGGAWSFPAREIRSANRWRNFQSRRSDDTGFRVVRELQ